MLRLACTIWTFCCFVNTVYAQEAEVVIPAGHNATIQSICFSPDQHYVATGAGELTPDNTGKGCCVKVWDVNTGNELYTFDNYTTPVTAVTFSHHAKWLATAAADGAILVWDTENAGELIHADAGSKVKQLFFTANDQALLVVADDISVWNIATGKLLYKLPSVGVKFNSVAYNESNDLLAIADTTGKVNYFQKGIFKSSDVLYTKDAKAVQFSNDKVLAIGTNIDLNGNITTAVREYTGSKPAYGTKAIPGNNRARYSIAARGNKFASFGDDKVSIYTTAGGEVSNWQSRKDETVNVLQFSPDGNTLAIAVSNNGGRHKIFLYNCAAGKTETVLSGHSALPVKVRFAEENTVHTWFDGGGRKGRYSWNISNGNLLKDTLPEGPAQQMSPSGNYVVTWNGAYTGKSGNTGAYIITRKADNKAIGTIEKSSAVVFSANDAFLLSKSTDNMQVTLYRVSDMKPMKPCSQLAAVRDMVLFNSGKQFITVGDDKTARLWSAANNNVVTTFRGHEDAVTVAVLSKDETVLATGGKDRKVIVWDITKSGTPLLVYKGHTEPISSIDISADKHYLVTGSADGTIRLWNTEKGNLMARLYALDSTDFLVNTEEGYYMSTSSAVRKLRFKVADRFYSFSQFDLQFNRPDKVMSAIGHDNGKVSQLYAKMCAKRLEKMGFNPDDFEARRSYNVPVVKLADQQKIPEKTNTRTLQFTVEARDSVYKLDRLQIYVNGVPVYGARGLKLAERKQNTLKMPVNLRLSAGRNLIEFSVLNTQAVESLKEQFTVELTGVTTLPNRYVVAIGVSEYTDSKHNLHYAAKDAQDFITLFSTQKKGFGKVEVKHLPNEKATKEQIMEIKNWLSGTSEDDQVLLFYAGHGLIDENMDYYLATHNVQFGKPELGGLAYNELEGLLDGIPARQKVLFIDACHSGEIDKGEMKEVKTANLSKENVEFRSATDKGLAFIDDDKAGLFERMKQLFVDLRVSTGTTVISSAGGTEFALEGKDWQNGVFTHCLLNGIRDIKADYDGDGYVTLIELKQYLLEEVPRLTANKQTPAFRLENLWSDIRL